MRGTSTIKRIAGCGVVAAALAVPGTADAAIWGPGCTTALVSAVSPSSSCGFDSPTNWSTVTVAPTGTVTATVRCNNFGYTYTSTRTVSQNTSWRASTPGTCSLILTAVSDGANAVGSTTPAIPPIYPYPVP